MQFFKISLLFALAIQAMAAKDDQSTGTTNIRQSVSPRPRQFRMDVYPQSNLKGTPQHMVSNNGVTSPCWNLDSKHIRSLVVNDPMIKITFYRSSDCRGASSKTIRSTRAHDGAQNLSLKAGSVKIVKLQQLVVTDK
ncbi:hypothetical protein J3Q64DRAFT_1289907 [Phycomyces blakesleeanus]|uniref:Uncharacterized protein n=2 Tax=Phycomyces blakesleeanus TaxID=4837 RepID=A0A162NKI7_PHYB8|nr:hypothetical protein PHYBLDRAFT_78913 [Phycomyces blakesleeanus NRRL 1555(-)]OAD75068.1 hypothetical protein PHYBLDRAFT_78913 [Phycomyces blakesleeanus NRRL 1555(-)]|eukprot:XP_018293108.1 hypothetical protein PHYBLDRAFT_78913 [Phycomyces blakesleeanus NRRL 1555(-)]